MKHDTKNLEKNNIAMSKKAVEACQIVWLSVYFFLFLSALGIAMPFLPVYLHNKGMSYSMIAVLASAYALTGFLTQAKIGHISDILGTRKYVAVFCCVMLGSSYFFYMSAKSFLLFLILFIWSGVGFFSGMMLPQVIASDWATAEQSTTRLFSVPRLWGTIGFIVALVIVSIFPKAAEGNRFLLLCGCLYISSAFPMLMLKENFITKTTKSMFRCASEVLKRDRTWLFLVCYLFFRMCESGTFSYLSLYLKELGGDTSTFAIAYCISAASEAPFIIITSRLIDRIGIKKPLIISFCVWPIRLFLLAMATTTHAVYWVQILHSITFGIMMVASIAFVAEVAPKEMKGTAQGIHSATNAAAMTAGPLFMGIMSDHIGIGSSFKVMAALMIIILVIFLIFVKEPNKRIV
ncbi:MAG: MFS transporter [Armatimonadota bacterium]